MLQKGLENSDGKPLFCRKGAEIDENHRHQINHCENEDYIP